MLSKAELQNWLERQGQHAISLQALKGDASLRRYWRVGLAGEKTILLMDATSTPESLAPYVHVSHILGKAGGRVPEIYTHDPQQHIIALEDLGDRSLWQYWHQAEESAENKSRLLHQAVENLALLQNIPPIDLPLFSPALLEEEMDLFRDWFMTAELKQTTQRSKAWASAWVATKKYLLTGIEAQPQGFVHRDYHSRNLMLLPTDRAELKPYQLVMLDFQDAVIGPANYDLVSILRDYYCLLDSRLRDALIDRFLDFSRVYRDHSRTEFIRDCDWVSAQRHLKVIGIFARLKHRDNKPQYLLDIPRACDYLLDVCQRHTELAWLQDVLSSVAMVHWRQRDDG